MAIHLRVREFLQLESSSAIILLMTTMLAMISANSPLAFIHQKFIGTFLFWINEGLMAVFFLVIGLELKRSFLEGQFSRISDVMLPAVAALGGMVIPALIYCLINQGNPDTLKGWSTPVATDIAFSLGILSLFGRRVPVALKLFLLALAIFDDVGAILIIALFYSHGIAYLWMGIEVLLIVFLFFLNFLNVKSLIPYLILGIFLWVAFLKTGIHPTIAGVLLALAIPDEIDRARSPLHRLENTLHPYVAYLIMPLFALANAGISLQGLTLDIFTNEIVLGIILGLFVGKPLGVFIFSWVLIQLNMAKLPENSSWAAFFGVALLCGIGFTMSLFLGTLSLGNVTHHLVEVRLGVIIGSLLSGLGGAIVLLIAFSKYGRLSKRSQIVG